MSSVRRPSPWPIAAIAACVVLAIAFLAMRGSTPPQETPTETPSISAGNALVMPEPEISPEPEESSGDGAGAVVAIHETPTGSWVGHLAGWRVLLELSDAGEGKVIGTMSGVQDSRAAIVNVEGDWRGDTCELTLREVGWHWQNSPVAWKRLGVSTLKLDEKEEILSGTGSDNVETYPVELEPGDDPELRQLAQMAEAPAEDPGEVVQEGNWTYENDVLTLNGRSLAIPSGFQLESGAGENGAFTFRGPDEAFIRVDCTDSIPPDQTTIIQQEERRFRTTSRYRYERVRIRKGADAYLRGAIWNFHLSKDGGTMMSRTIAYFAFEGRQYSISIGYPLARKDIYSAPMTAVLNCLNSWR